MFESLDPLKFKVIVPLVFQNAVVNYPATRISRFIQSTCLINITAIALQSFFGIKHTEFFNPKSIDRKLSLFWV